MYFQYPTACGYDTFYNENIVGDLINRQFAKLVSYPVGTSFVKKTRDCQYFNHTQILYNTLQAIAGIVLSKVLISKLHW